MLGRRDAAEQRLEDIGVGRGAVAQHAAVGNRLVAAAGLGHQGGVDDDLVVAGLGGDLEDAVVRRVGEAAGLDPNDLAESDPSKMDFGSGGNTDSKAWKDIWGCGQGIGAVKAVLGTGELVERLITEYEAARERILAASSAST